MSVSGQSPITVSVTSQPTTLVVSVNRGERGDKGDKGDAGLAAYTHTQSTLSVSWSINHSLNRYVSITVYRQDGLKVDGTIINNGPNVRSGHEWHCILYLGVRECLPLSITLIFQKPKLET